MRVQCDYPYKPYQNFGAWLFDDWHYIFIFMLPAGYLYYLLTTRAE